MQAAYALILVALAVIGVLCRDRAKVLTPLVLLINQGACTGVVLLTGDYYPVLFFMVADYASAIGLFILRRSHWQSSIMGVYACQLVCHAAYMLSDMGAGPTYYSFWALTYMGWVQLALIGGWIGTDLIGRWLPFSRGRRSETDAAPALAREADA